MDKKFIIGVAVFTILIIGAGIFLAGGSSSKAILGKTTGAKAQTNELKYSFGKVNYDKGIVIHSFPIKNIGSKELKIANLSTSCHCTEVYFEKKGHKGPKFNMRGSGGQSDWFGTLSPSEEGKIVTEFDPAFHGPQGIGHISRIVSVETNDPDHPYIEFSFSAEVIK